MKKLNITRERFEKSRYFTKKYGTLAYVSESGKVFKTSKGKLLKFQESEDIQFIDQPPESKDPEVQKLAKRVLTNMNKMRKTLEEYSIPSFSKEYRMEQYGKKLKIILKAGRDDSIYSRGGGIVLEFHVGGSYGGWGIFIYADGWIRTPGLYSVGANKIIEAFNIFLKTFPKDFNEYLRHYEDDEYDESSKLFKTNKGKILKFNESPYYDDDDELGSTNGRARRRTCSYCGNTVYVNSEGEYVCPHCGYDSELQDKWNESDTKFGKKFTKESIDTDPALVCPYCGGTRCSLEDADPLNFYDLDSFEGKTVNVRFGCYDCNKLYNVTFELRTKDVYPADEM